MDVDVIITEGVYDEKIEKVLKKLLDPQFKVKNDAYLNLLLTHISKYQEKDKGSDNLTKTFSCWITLATNEWESAKQKVSPDIFAFTLNLASFISEEETTFVKLNSLNVYERLLTIEDIRSTPPNIKLGFITLISAFLKHKSGTQWIMATNYWTNIISITLDAHTVYVTSSGCKFIANLLDKTFNVNRTYCQNVIKAIIDPLDNVTEDKSKTNSVHLELRNEAIAEILFPNLRIIKNVLTLLLQQTNMDLLKFINEFELNIKLKRFLLLSQTEELEFEIRSISYLLDFVDFFKDFSGSKEISYECLEKSRMKRSQQMFKELIKKGYLKSVLKLCYNGFIYWRSIKNKMPTFFHGDQQIEVENQLMIIQLIPILTGRVKMLGKSNFDELLKSDTLRDDFVTKTLKVTCTRTIQMGYIWRNYLLDNKTLEISTCSLMYILKSKPFYTREGGVTAFRGFVYCLKDIIDHLKDVHANILLESQENKFLETLLEAIEVFIGEFNITWKDSIESMCVTTLAVELLNFTMWTPQVVIKALSLLNITIRKYLAPSMALLMIDTLDDTGVKSLGTLLYAKCHDPCWEIRDSSLEVLCTMSYNANNRFPLFQKIILDAELPHLIVNMAIKDAEPFVRASGLRCLQEMVQVVQFWDNLKKIEDIHELFFKIMCRETEGIVRKEATTLICKIYKNQNYPESLFCTLYEVMANAAIVDLHWEVKVNALEFWKSVINNHLQHQGMIDGTFPEVTFSKEHRKIVNLTHVEVKKRLIKVLNQLSEIGCLAVFISAIQDDCDIEVSRHAVVIVSEFVNLLKRYDIDAQNSELDSSALNSVIDSPRELLPEALGSQLDSSPAFSSDSWRPVVTEYNSNVINSTDSSLYSPLSHSLFEANQDLMISVRAADITDDILDEILNSSDINVLKSLYNPSEDLLTDNMVLPKKTIVLPSQFITFTYKNIGLNLSEKSSWLNGLDDFVSLLDDILKDYEISDMNSMDCY